MWCVQVFRKTATVRVINGTDWVQIAREGKRFIRFYLLFQFLSNLILMNSFYSYFYVVV